MNNKQHITINIADVMLPLDIPPEKEELFRRIEKEVNNVYNYWCRSFTENDGFTPHRVLAMVAFRFAQLFFELQEKANSHSLSIDQAEKALDRLLLDVK